MDGKTRSRSAVTWWAIAWVVTLATYPFTNDHFHRISAARQLARYGEFPFRDFFDPGFVLTEFISAGLQRLFGDNLLGEMLWTSGCIATGALFVILLTRRLAPPRVSVGLIGTLVILAQPRPYDFDKFLFYPLGLFLCWQYVDQPRIGRLWRLAAAAVVAGMFRYDNGLFILAAGLATILTLHAHDLRTARRHLAILVAASAACAMPYLVFLQMNGGIRNAMDQMLTYAQREGGRTRLTSLPIPIAPELHIVDRPDHVQVRWSADADQSQLESRYTLHDGVPKGDPAARIWLYEIEDASRKNLRALIDDSHVVDTHLVDRATAALRPEEPGGLSVTASWLPGDAASALYWVFLLVPMAAVAIIWRSGAVASVEGARVIGGATMAVCVAGLVLREPLEARMSGAAAPTIVLGTWLWCRVHRNWLARIVGVAVLITVAVMTGWGATTVRLFDNVPTLPQRLRQAALSPPSPLFLPSTPVSGPINYLRRCTQRDDRVFAGWFAPELFFFSQRAFAGGMVVTFGHHWSERVNQQKIIDTLASQSVPVVILPNDNRDFQETYVDVTKYLLTHYRTVGTTAFGFSDGPTYVVLTHNDRVPVSTDSITSLPCFAPQEP